MEAQRLAIQCPICHSGITTGVKEHLYDHSKADLVDELRAHLEEEIEEEEE